jgi:hypothetical protein
MDKDSLHTPNGTHNTTNVKLKEATAARIKFEWTLKDERIIQGLQEAAKEKQLTIQQFMLETLENTLIKSGHLPSWWHQRQF